MKKTIRLAVLITAIVSFTVLLAVAACAEQTPIDDITIALDSGAFSGGKPFPAFWVDDGSNYYIEQATFYREMADYYVGDTLPNYRAGTVLKNVTIKLKPKSGYFFAFVGEQDGKSHESTVYQVEYKGKKYTPYVVSDYENNRLTVYLDVTFEDGMIYTTTIKELEAPYHLGPLDREIVTEDALETVSVKYLMFGKELEEYEKGDNIGITVRLKTKDQSNTINGEGHAYWEEQKLNSTSTKLISANEVEYTFAYTVDALPEQYISHVELALPAYAVGDAPLLTAFTKTKGIKVDKVTFDESFEKFEAGKEYHANIFVSKLDEYVFDSKVTATVNGVPAGELLPYTSQSEEGGAKRVFRQNQYYVKTKVVPQNIVNTGGSDDEDGSDTVISGTINIGQTTQEYEFNINLEYNMSRYTAEQGEKVVLDFTHNMDLMLCSDIEYQWYKSASNVYGTGEMIDGGDKKKLEVDTSTPGTVYYYCIMCCTFDGEDYSSDHSESPVVKITTVESSDDDEEDQETDAEKFELEPVGLQKISVSSTETKITLKAKVTGTEKAADFQWYRCDKDGKTIDEKGNGVPLSMGDMVAVGPIPQQEASIPRYYRCTAMIGNTAKYIIFEVMLELPENEVINGEYIFPFSDVKVTDWYYGAVNGAYKMGLINGKSEDMYKPGDNMTYAEAVKLAVCMNILYNGGNPSEDIKNGADVWFSTYMKYAIDNKIIDGDLTAKANEKITRREYVYIFSKALPKEAFKEKNDIPTGSIPDIKQETLLQDKAIYLFYRAGILSGVDAKGTFMPGDNIKRSEVAAILIRMMDEEARVDAPSELGK